MTRVRNTPPQWRPGRNAGRSTTGEAAVPYYVGSPITEAAKHLRLTVTRFLSERASEAEVDEAYSFWLSARAKRDAGPVVEVTGETITDRQIRQLWGEALDRGSQTSAKIAKIALGEWHGCHEFVASRHDVYCGFVREDGMECGRMDTDDTIHIAAARVYCAAAWNRRTP